MQYVFFSPISNLEEFTSTKMAIYEVAYTKNHFFWIPRYKAVLFKLEYIIDELGVVSYI